jgi:ABC-2 type transport system permease protein
VTLSEDTRQLIFIVIASGAGIWLGLTALFYLWRTFSKGLLQKELHHFFFSPIAWLTLAAFTFVNGYVFLYLFQWYQVQPNEPLVRVFFGELNAFFWLLQLIVIPAITMRLIAEERHDGTIETLLTAPVHDAEVVMAKFYAATFFYGLLWVPTLVPLGAAFYYAAPEGFFGGLIDSSPAGLAAFGHVYDRMSEVMDLGPVICAYLGTLLMGAAWIAVGILFSGFCKNQVVAFITAFVVLLALFSVGFLESLIIDDPGFWPGFSAVLERLSFQAAFEPFPRGIIDTRSVVYFLIVCVVSLILSVRVVESQKWR